MKRIIIASLILLAPLVSACHTVHGVGKDITAVGHGVENTSGKNN